MQSPEFKFLYCPSPQKKQNCQSLKTTKISQMSTAILNLVLRNITLVGIYISIAVMESSVEIPQKTRNRTAI
jgi:hypothetical protein